MQLEFKVKNQTLKRLDRNKVVADSKNYLTAHFDFTEEWTGTKTAIFKKDETAYEVILENNSCTVPWEVITKGIVEVSVFGGNLITADICTFEVKVSGYIEGETPQAPSQSIYEQIIQMFNDIENVEEEEIKQAVQDYVTENPITVDNFKLLNTLTLTESVSEMTLTKDSEGNNISVDEMYAVIHAYCSDSDLMTFFDTNLTDSIQLIDTPNAAEEWFTIRINKFDAYKQVEFSNKSASGGRVTNYVIPQLYEGDKLTEINYSIETGGEFLTDSTMYLFGR